jgi:hypothetical protein
MSLVVKCSCGKSLQAKEEHAGKRVRCPACGTILMLPAPAARADDPLDLGDLDLSNPALAGPTLPAKPALQPLGRTYAPPKPTGSLSGHVVLWVLLAVGGGIGLLVMFVVVGGFLWFAASRKAAVAPPVPPTFPATQAPAPQPVAPAADRLVTPAVSADAVPWEVQADPPRQPLVWPDQPNVDIPIRAGKDRVLFPATPSPFVVVGMNISGGDGVQVWDLVQQQKAGELLEPVKDGNIAAVSPDGQFLAVKAADPKHYGKLQLLSFRTGRTVREIECEDPKVHLQTLDFLSPTLVVTQAFGATDQGYRYAISVWDVTAGNRLADMPTDSTYQKGKMAISPGGRYLATVAGDKLLAYDLQAGRLAGRLALKPLLGDRLGALFGMSFSPDGRQLAVVMGSTNSQVVLFDFAAGTVADQLELAGKPPTSSAYRGAAVEWLDDKGWCLFGGTIIDRATRRAVWNLVLPITDSLTPRRTLPTGWIAATGPYASKRMKFTPIPWDKIQAGLAALAGDEAALLKPGQAVSLDLTADQLRFGTATDTTTKLAEIFQERFHGDGITVADNQPIVLKVTYSESAGETLVERQGFVGPVTGRTVQATKVDVKMVLVASASGTVVWQHDLTYNPHAVTVMGKDATDANVHDAILRQLLYQLSFAPIPYFVPKDPALGPLPGTTKLSDK